MGKEGKQDKEKYEELWSLESLCTAGPGLLDRDTCRNPEGSSAAL